MNDETATPEPEESKPEQEAPAKQRPPINGARLHVMRFYAKMQRGRKYGQSAADAIATASSVEALQAAYEKAATFSVSPRTRRRIETAARERLRQLEAQPTA